MTSRYNTNRWSKLTEVSRDYVNDLISVTELRYQLNLYSDTSQDSYLDLLDKTAKVYIEDRLGVSFHTRTVKAYYSPSTFITSGEYTYLPLPNSFDTTLSVSSIQYYGLGVKTLTTLATSHWFFDITSERLAVKLSDIQFNTDYESPLVVNLTYGSASGSSLSTNPAIKHAAMLLVTHWYRNRSTTSEGMLNNIPHGVDSLLEPYREVLL